MTLLDYYLPILVFVVPMAIVGCLCFMAGLTLGQQTPTPPAQSEWDRVWAHTDRNHAP